jgi:type I restriction-modification system DNA methylase subunit
MTKDFVKSKERKDENGEVFTPPYIVDEMLALLPEGILEDSSKTFLDPTCGNGNILVRILERRIELGLDPTESAETLYGYDLMQDNVDECIQRIKELAPLATIKSNILQKDFFKVRWHADFNQDDSIHTTSDLF